MRTYTISGRQANLWSLLFVAPVLLFDVIPFIFIWCNFGNNLQDTIPSIFYHNTFVIKYVGFVFLILLSGIVFHELIHGISMAIFAPNGWKSVSFGFNAKAFAPYAHCKEPLKPAAYRTSLVLPGILLGDIPVIISWVTGNIFFLFFGVLFSLAASGDIIIFWISRKIKDGMLQDHPDEIGFIHCLPDKNL